MGMKTVDYRQVKAVHFESDTVKGVSARVVVGKADGAPNFCMRVFEIAPGGHTPKHAHPWEHEMFCHEGQGEVLLGDAFAPVAPGVAVFVPADATHQIRNTGTKTLVMVCLVPAVAPEI